MRYVGDFRAMKSHVHDGGIHTMFYARWPERFKAGHVNDRISAHIDMLPTLAAASGAPLPEGVKIDGTNLLPLLEGTSSDWPDRALVLQTHRGDAPIPFHHMAVRTQDWKLVHPTGFGSETMKERGPFRTLPDWRGPRRSRKSGRKNAGENGGTEILLRELVH